MLLLTLMAVAVAVAVSACLGGGTPAPAAESSVPAPTSSPLPTAASSPSTVSTTEPTATAAPTESPTAEPSPSPSSEGAAAVEGCAGNDGNREFFAKAAAAMTWPVYCPALPDRWVVVTGRYAGGMLEITYRGPSGSTLELHEGAFCTDGTGCVPEGGDAGTTNFGDRTATLVHFEDGRVAAVVDRGKTVSWLAIGDGLTDEAFQAIAAALIRLD